MKTALRFFMLICIVSTIMCYAPIFTWSETTVDGLEKIESTLESVAYEDAEMVVPYKHPFICKNEMPGILSAIVPAFGMLGKPSINQTGSDEEIDTGFQKMVILDEELTIGEAAGTLELFIANILGIRWNRVLMWDSNNGVSEGFFEEILECFDELFGEENKTDRILSASEEEMEKYKNWGYVEYVTWENETGPYSVMLIKYVDASVSFLITYHLQETDLVDLEGFGGIHAIAETINARNEILVYSVEMAETSADLGFEEGYSSELIRVSFYDSSSSLNSPYIFAFGHNKDKERIDVNNEFDAGDLFDEEKAIRLDLSSFDIEYNKINRTSWDELSMSDYYTLISEYMKESDTNISSSKATKLVENAAYFAKSHIDNASSFVLHSASCKKTDIGIIVHFYCSFINSHGAQMDSDMYISMDDNGEVSRNFKLNYDFSGFEEASKSYSWAYNQSIYPEAIVDISKLNY